MKLKSIVFAFVAILALTPSLHAQNKIQSLDVAVCLDQIYRSSVYASFDADSSVNDYYVLRTTPELAQSYTMDDIVNIIDTMADPYGTAFHFTNDTSYIYLGRNYPNDSVVLVIVAFADNAHSEGLLSYYGYRTAYAGGEGVAEITWTLVGNYSTGFRFTIQPNDDCAYWYMNILDNDTIEANGWNTEDVMNYTLSHYNYSYGYADMGWQNDDYGNEVTVYIFPFNINRELGTTFVQPFRVGDGPIVAIDNIDGNMLSVYPNPAENVLNIQAEGIREISIISSLGSEVFRGQAHGDSVKVDISSLAAGMYVVNIKTATGSYSRKLVVK